MEIKKVSNIQKKKRKDYSEVYDKMMFLKQGEALTIVLNNHKAYLSAYTAVHNYLKRNDLLNKYELLWEGKEYKFYLRRK